jgi:hypothetical protein
VPLEGSPVSVANLAGAGAVVDLASSSELPRRVTYVTFDRLRVRSESLKVCFEGAKLFDSLDQKVVCRGTGSLLFAISRQSDLKSAHYFHLRGYDLYQDLKLIFQRMRLDNEGQLVILLF